VILVAHEGLHIHGGRVVEALLRLAEEKGFWVDPGLLSRGVLRQNGVLCLFQHAIHSAQHVEGEDDLAVLRLLVVAQQVGDQPDKWGKAHGFVNPILRAFSLGCSLMESTEIGTAIKEVVAWQIEQAMLKGNNVNGSRHGQK
jgi:hypothetical protein